jgi:hypothetical protein
MKKMQRLRTVFAAFPISYFLFAVCYFLLLAHVHRQVELLQQLQLVAHAR